MTKKLRKILTGTILIFILSGNLGYAENEHWALNDYNYLRNYNILQGYLDGSIKLDEYITRAEFIKTINNSFSFTERKEVEFKDLNKKHWAYSDIEKAMYIGYIEGYKDDTIRLEESITREEASKILASILSYESNSQGFEFKDKEDISKWALSYIDGLVDKNIVSGYKDGNFRPKGLMKRGEAFKILRRAIEYIDNQDIDVVDGNLLIKEVNDLENIKINGDLIITGKNKSITLKNLLVKGEIIILGKLERLEIIDSSFNEIKDKFSNKIELKETKRALDREKINKLNKLIKGFEVLDFDLYTYGSSKNLKSGLESSKKLLREGKLDNKRIDEEILKLENLYRALKIEEDDDTISNIVSPNKEIEVATDIGKIKETDKLKIKEIIQLNDIIVKNKEDIIYPTSTKVILSDGSAFDVDIDWGKDIDDSLREYKVKGRLIILDDKWEIKEEEKNIEINIKIELSEEEIDNEIIPMSDYTRKVYLNLFNKYNKYDKEYSYLVKDMSSDYNGLSEDHVFTKKDMKNLRVFYLDNDNSILNDELLEPLKYALNLESFDVNYYGDTCSRELESFDFIKNCKKINKFYYLNNGIKYGIHNQSPLKDIEALSELYELKDLRINMTMLEDLSALKNLKLKTLVLPDNRIKEVNRWISDMDTLERLDLENNEIEDIDDFYKLKNLRSSYLYNNRIEDISSLSGLEELEALLVNGNYIKDISSVEKMNLKRLYIDRNPLSSDYFNIVEELSSVNTLQIGEIDREIFEWMKKSVVREEGSLSDLEENNARLYAFEKLELDLSIPSSYIEDGFLVIDNPLIGLSKEPVVQDEYDEEHPINESIEFKDDKIRIAITKYLSDSLKVEYRIYTEDSENVFGQYGQPASIAGNVILNISIGN